MQIDLRSKVFRILQVIAVSLFILPPFIITPNGNNAVRFSFENVELYFFNSVFTFDHFFTLSIFLIMCVFLFILFTQVFGRLWCGWLCPQSVFLSAIEKILKLFKKKSNIVLETVLAILAALVLTLVLLFYFVSPYDFIDQLFGDSGYVLIPAFIVTFVFIFLDFLFFRYKWCKYICPYAKLQSVMSDSDTLFIGMNKNALSECIKCNACIRICPVEIDPRNTPSSECVYCERCIIACEKSLSKRGKHTILDYNWGTRFRFFPFRPNVIITFILSLMLLIYFIYLSFCNIPLEIDYTFRNIESNRCKLNIIYKNRTDSSLIIGLKLTEKPATEKDILISTVLRAKQRIELKYDLACKADNGAAPQISISTNKGYKKDITLLQLK